MILQLQHKLETVLFTPGNKLHAPLITEAVRSIKSVCVSLCLPLASGNVCPVEQTI